MRFLSDLIWDRKCTRANIHAFCMSRFQFVITIIIIIIIIINYYYFCMSRYHFVIHKHITAKETSGHCCNQKLLPGLLSTISSKDPSKSASWCNFSNRTLDFPWFLINKSVEISQAVPLPLRIFEWGEQHYCPDSFWVWQFITACFIQKSTLSA